MREHARKSVAAWREVQIQTEERAQACAREGLSDISAEFQRIALFARMRADANALCAK